MAFPDAWTEIAYVTISKLGAASDIEFLSVTETIDISMGDKQVEHMPMVGGGRVVKYSPEEDTEITLELYPVSIDVAEADGGLFQHFYGGTPDTSDPKEKRNYDESGTPDRPNVRDRFRVAVLWSDDPDVTGGSAATAASTDSLRFIARHCYLVSHKVDFTDDIMKVTATFKCGAANKQAASNSAWQSGNQTALVALQPYAGDVWID